MKYVRSRGRCRRCQRVVLLARSGTLFLHGDRDPAWSKRAQTPTLGAHCPGGMTTEFDPCNAAVGPPPARLGGS